jgi:hypothetical protein
MSSLNWQGQTQAQPVTTRIWIESVRLRGTSLNLLEPQKPYPVDVLCANHTQGPNEVAPSALQPCLEPQISIALLSKWAEKGDLIVKIGWRPEPNGTYVETDHKVSRVHPSSHSHGVVFEGNIDFVSRAANHMAEFTRATQATMAAMALSPYRSPYFAPAMVPEYFPCWHGGPIPDSGEIIHQPITGATRRPTRQQDQLHTHNSGLVERYQRYADEKYRSTGDATEVLRAMELSAKVAASQLQ